MHINTKMVGWVVVILVIAGAAYLLISKTPEPLFDESGNAIGAQTVGSDLLQLLSDLKSINLTTDIFNDEVFMSLTDWSVNLPAPALGRPNPFERIGVDVGSVTSAPATAPRSGTSATTTSQ